METQTFQDDNSNSEYGSDRIDISDENIFEDHEERTVEMPEREMDEPPRYARIDSSFGISELPPQERRNLYKWLKNFSFIKTILFLMFVVYIVDLFCTKGQSSLKEPFFEVLKTLLLTVSGYVFAKSGKINYIFLTGREAPFFCFAMKRKAPANAGADLLSL